MVEKIAVLIISYLVGSIPIALIYSKYFHKEDIRKLGDGNMGASNIKRVYGSRAGITVGVLDILKGSLAILIALVLQLPIAWQLAAGSAAILGHDFPIFAGFRGGQGLATTAGVFLVLYPVPWLIGGVLYGVIYLISHKSNLAKGAGMGLYALLGYFWGAPLTVIAFIMLALLFIPLKQWFDRSRRANIQVEENDLPISESGENQ